MHDNAYKLLIKGSPFGFAHHRIITDEEGLPVDYIFLDVNESFEKLTGLKAADIINKNVTSVIPGILKADFDWISFFGKIALNGGSETFEQFSEPLGRWYKVYVNSNEKLHFSTFFSDISVEKEQALELQKSNQRYRGIIESQNDLIVRVDNENRFTFVNENYCQTFGKRREELIGKSFAPLVHEQDIAHTLEQMKKLSEAPYRCILEQRALTVNGWRWIQWEDSAILSEHREVLEIQGVGRDITALKEKENELKAYQHRLAMAQSFTGTGTWEYNIRGKKLYWSAECEKLFGLAEGSFEGNFNDFLKRVHPDDKETVLKLNRPIVQLNEGIPLNYEHRIIREDGEIRWVKESAGVVFDNAGNPAQIIGLITDITTQKEDEETIENEKRLRDIINNIDGVFWLRSANRHDMLYVSPSYELIFGKTPESLIKNPNSFMDAIHEEDKERVMKAFSKFLETGKFNQEYRIIRPDRDIRWVSSKTFPVKNEYGKIIRYAGIVNDVTNRKTAEIEAIEKSVKLNAIFGAIPDVFFTMDKEGIYHDVIAADPSKLFEPAEKIIGKSLFDFFPSDEAKKQLLLYEECLSEKKLVIFEYQINHYDKVLHFEARLNPLGNDRLLAIVRDITDTKLLQDSYKDELEFRQFLFKKNKDGLFILNKKHAVVDANDEFCNMLGYKLEELLQMSESDFSAVLTEEEVKTNSDQKGVTDSTFVSQHQRKDRSVYDVEISARSFSWKGENLVICSCRDVSERLKMVKETLDAKNLAEANQRRFEEVAAFTGEFIWEVDKNGVYTYANSATEKILGYKPEELVGQMSYYDLAPEKDRNIFRNEVTKMFDSQLHLNDLENIMIAKNGKQIFAITNGIPILGPDGELTGYRGSDRDITSQVEAEARLLQSEKKYRQLVENINDAIFTLDAKGIITYMSPVFQTISGYIADDYTGKHFSLFVHPEHLNQVMDEFERLQTGVIYPSEYRINTRNGNDVWVRSSTKPNRNKNNEIEYTGVVQDITRVKNAQENLREKTNYLNAILQAIPDTLFIIQKDGIILDIHGPDPSKLVSPANELIGKSIRQVFNEEESKKHLTLYEECIRNRTTSVIEFELKIKRKSLIFESSISPIDNERVLTIVRDVSGARAMKDALEEELNFRRFLFENNKDGVVMLNHNHKVIEGNAVFCEMLGYSLEELKKMHTWDFDAILSERDVRDGFGTGIDSTFESMHQRKDGSLYDVEVSARSFHWKGSRYVLCNCRDITRRKESEKAIRHSKQQLDLFFSQSLQGFCFMILDEPITWNENIDKANTLDYFFQHLRITKINQAMLNQYGAREEDFVGLTLFSLFEHDLDFAREKAMIALEAGHWKGETNEFRLDGKPIVIEGQYTLLYDDSGRISGMFSVQADITERKNALERIHRSEQKFRIFAENTFNWEFWEAPDGTFIHHSPACKEITGFTPEDLISNIELLYSLIHPDDRESYIDHHQYARNERQKGSMHFRIITPDGQLKHIEHLCKPVFGLNNEYLGVRGTNLDVTERIRFEEKLHDSEMFANAVINTTPALLYIYDLENNTNIWSNDLHKRFFASLIGDNSALNEFELTQLLHPDDYSNLSSQLKTLIFENNTARIESEIRFRYNGSWRWMKNLASVFRTNEQGQAIQIIGAMIDIDDRKMGEQIIKNNEERFKQIAQLSQTVIWEIDKYGLFTYVSPASEAVYGYKPEELTGKINYFNLHPEEGRQKFMQETFQRSEKDKRFIDFINPVMKPDGEIVWVKTNGIPLTDDEGSIRGFRGSDENVSRRLKAEEEMRKFKIISDEANYGTAITTPDGKILYLNKAFANMHGWKVEEVLGKGIEVFHNQEQIPRVSELLNMIRASGSIENMELFRCRKDGSVFPSLMNAFVLYDENNKPVSFNSTIIDISNIKSYEMELIAAKENAERSNHLQELLTGISNTYINLQIEELDRQIIESFGEIGEFVNVDRIYAFSVDIHKQKASNTHEWCAEGIEPQIKFLQHVPFSDAPDWFNQITSGHSTYIHDVSELPEGSDQRNILEQQGIKSLLIVPMLDEGACIGFIGFDSVKRLYQYSESEENLLQVLSKMLVNVMKRKAVELDLINAREKAEESDRLKSSFLAAVSHELRTPLNHILGFSDIIRSSDVDPETQSFASIIYESGSNFLAMVEDIFDLALIEQSEIRMRLQSFTLMDIFIQNKSSLEEIYNASGKINEIKLKFSPDPNILQNFITTDRSKINQVLSNLFKNAVKFTDKGEIEFGIRQEGSNIIRFYVRDTGIGIPEDKQNIIFDFFRQVDDSNTRLYGGLGIGLAISKKIAEVMNAEIRVESLPAAGSTFSFAVPVELQKGQSSLQGLVNSNKCPELSGKSILLVEDDSISLNLVVSLLKATNAILITASNGKEAIEQFEKNPGIDLVLMDLKMPVMDGFAASKTLKQKKPDIQIIALTAYTYAKEKSRAMESGCAGILTKPINQDILFKEIGKLLS